MKKKIIGDFIFSEEKGGCVRDKFSNNIILDKTGIDLEDFSLKKKRKR